MPGPQHSQCLEAWLAHVPGLKVVCPSNVEDAYALVRAAIEDDDPVIVVENKALYATKGDLPEPPACRADRTCADGEGGQGRHHRNLWRDGARSASPPRQILEKEGSTLRCSIFAACSLGMKRRCWNRCGEPIAWSFVTRP